MTDTSPDWQQWETHPTGNEWFQAKNARGEIGEGRIGPSGSFGVWIEGDDGEQEGGGTVSKPTAWRPMPKGAA